MRVFITRGSGWIGSATVDELIGAGYDITGLARSDGSAAALQSKGIRVLRGDLDEPDALRRGASEAEAVVHLANKHNWNDTSISNQAERAAVQVIAEALVGTDKAFVLASGVAGLVAGRPAVEDDPSPFEGPDSPRGGSENLALGFLDQGVRTISVRFAPTVHGWGDPQFMAFVVAAAHRHGVSAYVGNGVAVWSAVHRDDAAQLVRLGLESAPAGSLLHAVGESAVSTKAIARAIGQAFEIPVVSIAAADAVEHFGFVGALFGMSFPALSDHTRELLDWTPSHPSLIDDIDAGAYGSATGTNPR